MKKCVLRGIAIFIDLCVLLSVITYTTPRVNSETEIFYSEKSVHYFNEDLVYSTQDTSSDCLIQIEQCQKYIELLSININHITDLSIKRKANQEIIRINSIIDLYIQNYEQLLQKELEEAKWQSKMEKYPEATQIWRYMKDNFHWSDETCAAVLGNMMAEVGGGTLDLSNWNANGASGYGLIQWIGGRRSDLKNRYGAQPSIEQQLLYMYDELYGINTTKQVNDNILQIILNENEQYSAGYIAYIFAVYYERCHANYVNIRINYAEQAYSYFVD